MSRPSGRDVLRNAIFIIVVPGVVGGLIPALVTRYESRDWGAWGVLVRVAAWLLIALGAAVLLYGVWRFAAEGRGTPSPTAPTEQLVVAGPYRYVRNPMYLAVGAVIAGQALLFGSVALVVYLAIFVVAVVSFVRGYEEPTLRRTFGAEYEAYCQRVPAWVPRGPR